MSSRWSRELLERRVEGFEKIALLLRILAVMSLTGEFLNPQRIIFYFCLRLVERVRRESKMASRSKNLCKMRLRSSKSNCSQ